MLVMISPLQAHLSETLTSLKFATKVRIDESPSLSYYNYGYVKIACDRNGFRRSIANIFDAGTQYPHWDGEAAGES